MKEFEFNYDKKNDDLFIYLPNKRSKGAVEIGNFVFDFDEKEDLVAIQILEASEILSKLVSKILELTKIKSIKADIINFRNMAFIRIEITTGSAVERVSMPIPRIKREKSPALSY
jgi:uncharacterized protein YuzE